MINIERALPIGSNNKYPSDWMSPNELKWLATRANEHNMIAELGCWKGRSTRAMGDNTNGIVYAVDPWSNQTGPGYGGHGDSEGNSVDINDIYNQFISNTQDLIDCNRIKVIREFSWDAAYRFSKDGTKFDMVFIDALHDYEYVYLDITMWTKLLVPGGLLCGHDYSEPGSVDHCPGVYQSVNELVGNVKVLDEVATGTSYPNCRIWWRE